MPELFRVLGYKIYFWSNENDEPVHVHCPTGVPSKNETKLWITSDGNVILEHNKSRIPAKDLSRIIKFLESNEKQIVRAWVEFFGTKAIFVDGGVREDDEAK